MFGSHKIQKRELDELSQGYPETIIVGTGTNCATHMATGTESCARGKNLNLMIQLSHYAVARLNGLAERKKKIAGLTHITCHGINLMSIWFFCNTLSCVSGILFYVDKYVNKFPGCKQG